MKFKFSFSSLFNHYFESHRQKSEESIGSHFDPIVSSLTDQSNALECQVNALEGQVNALEGQVNALCQQNQWLIKELGEDRLSAFNDRIQFRHDLLRQIISINSSSLGVQSIANDYNKARIDKSRLCSLEEVLLKFQELAPLNVETFLKAFDVGTNSYETLPETSCSTINHPESLLFFRYLKPFLRGNVLDIGCGPQPVPSYLQDYPVERIYGIDPISKQSDHPFDFYSGFGEFLPWEDASFDVIISGTTLDHYYLLDQGLSEVVRCLTANGYFIAWISEFSDCLDPYDPYTKIIQSYDDEHLFHINSKWFIPYAEEMGLKLVEVISFDLPFKYSFYAFVKA